MTDSIHLSPESIDDDANSLIAGNRAIGVANVKLDCHGDLTFVTREVPTVKRNICRFHGWCPVVMFAVGFAVGSPYRSIAGMFWHDWICEGGYWLLYDINV